MVRRFRVSGLVMWLFPCRGPLGITKPLRVVVSDNVTTRSAVVRTSAAVAARSRYFSPFSGALRIPKAVPCRIVVSSTPMNVEGEAQVKAVSGEDYDRSAM